RDGRHHDVDVLHGPPDSPQLGEHPAELRGRVVGVRPDDEPRQGPPQSLEIALARDAPFDPGPELTQDRGTDADAIPGEPLGVRPLEPPMAAIDEVLGDAGVEQEAPHPPNPCCICRRTASMLYCRIRSSNSAIEAASSGVYSSGSIVRIHADQSASAAGSSRHSLSSIPIRSVTGTVGSIRTSVPSGQSGGASSSTRPPLTIDRIASMALPSPVVRLPSSRATPLDGRVNSGSSADTWPYSQPRPAGSSTPRSN